MRPSLQVSLNCGPFPSPFLVQDRPRTDRLHFFTFLVQQVYKMDERRCRTGFSWSVLGVILHSLKRLTNQAQYSTACLRHIPCTQLHPARGFQLEDLPQNTQCSILCLAEMAATALSCTQLQHWMSAVPQLH